MNLLTGGGKSVTRSSPRWPIAGAAFLYLLVALACGAHDMVVSDLVPAGVAALVLAVWGFFRQGREVINGSSMFCYAVGLFIAFPAIYVGLTDWPAASETSPRWLLLSLCIGVVGMCVAMMFGQQVPPPSGSRSSDTQSVLIRPGAALFIGVFLIGIALVTAPLDTTLGTRIPQALGGVSLFVLALGLAEARARAHVALLAVGLALAGAGYYLFLFSAFGRLVLGSIACGVLAILAIRRRHYLIKCLLFLGTAPGLIFLAQQRADYVVATWNYRVPSDLGIASVVGPYVSFTKILIASSANVIAPTWGSTLWASSVFWVPRQFWPGKPEGFGAEMVAITQPGNVHLPGFSDAATIFGEAVWNVGLLLLPVVMMGIGAVIGWLDRLVGRTVGGTGRDSSSPIGVLVLAVLLGGVLNLTWGGTFTFVTRATGMLVILGLAWAGTTFAKRSAPTRELADAGGHRQAGEVEVSVLAPPTHSGRASGGEQMLDDDIRRAGH